MRKAQNKAAPINSSGIAPVPMRIGSLLDEDSTVKNLKKKKQGLEPEFGGKSSLPSSSAAPKVNPKLLKMKPKEPPKGSAIQEFYRNLQKANAQYRYNLQNHPIKPKIFVELVKSTSSSPKRRNLAPSAEEPFLVAKGTITVNEGIVHFRVYQILNICYSVDLALNDSSALEVEEEENHVNQPASDERRKWTVFIPQTELTNELNRLFTFSRKSYYYHKFLYFIMICVEVHFATSITPTNVLPSIYPSEGGWMHPSSRSNSPFQYNDAHERGNNGSEAKTRKFISKTSFQQASFDRLCQYFIQKIYLNASKRLFLFFQRCLNSFLHEKELIKQRKIKQSQHMASTRAREKISQYVLEKQQRLEYLAATNPLLVAKEMKNDLLFNKFSKQLTGSAGTSANRGNESLDDSTLESLLGLPITSYSNVNKTGSAVGTAKPVMTPTTPAAASTPNGVAYEGSSGTMSNNLAESSSLKSNSRDMALNPANHHRGYSVSGNNTPLLNPTKPSSPPRHASVKPGDSQLPPRKARLPSVVKKSSVQYNGARHYSVTATSDDILGTLSNPSNDVRDNHYIHGSVLMPGMNPIGSNNANLSSFRNEISSILGVFEEEIHTLKQELETQKLNYFYSRGRLDLAYTPYEEEKTDLVAPRSRSGATPSSTTNTGKPLSEATNDTSQNNVNILMNSLSTSLPASARTSMLSSGEAGRRENNTSPRASASALEHENHQLKSELENMQKKLESFETSLQQTQQMAQRMEEQKLQQLQEQWQQNTHQLLQSTTETARQQLLQEFQELFQAKEEEMHSLQSQLALMEQKKPPGQRDRSISAEVMKFQLVEERLQHEYEEMMEQQKALQAQIQQLMQEKQQAVHQPSKAGRRESVVGFEDLEEEEASPSKEFPGLGLSLFDYYRGSSNNTNKLMKSPRKVAETPRNQNGEELHMYRGDSTQAIKVTTNNKKPTNKKINSSTDTPMSSHRSAHMSVSGEVKPLAESVRESSELPSPTSANDNNEEEVALISEDKVDEVLPTSAVEQPLPDSPSNFIPFGITAKSISRQFLLSPGSIKPPEISIVLSPKSDGKLREGDVTVTHNTTLNAPSSRPMTPKTPKSPKMPKNMGGGSGGGVGGGGGGGAPRGGRKLHPATAGTRSANAKKMAGVQLASSSMSRRAVAQQQQEKKGFSWFSFFFGKRATTPAPTEKDSSMHQSEAGESHMSGINLEQTNIFDLHESRDEEEEKRQKEEEEAKAREEARKREEERIYKNACILQKYMKQVTFLYSTASKSNLIYLRWRFLLPVINSPELLAKRLEQESDFLNQMISFSQEIIALILEKLVQHLQGTKSSAGGRNDVWNVLDEQLLQFPLLIFLLIEGMMKKYEKMSIIYPFLMLSHFQQFVEQFLFLLIPLQYFLSSSSILPTKNRGGGVGSRLAAEAAENWNNLLKKYFNLMRIVYKIDLLKCMEDFTMMKQYMNFLLKGIHLFHSLGMKRCQQHPTDSLQDAQPFSLSMPVTTSASEGSVKNGFDESEGSLSPRSRHKKEKKRVKDDGDIVIPPQLQELFQHLLIQVILLPVTSLEQIDIHHGKFIVLLFKLIEKHYDMASGKTGEGKRNDQFQQPLVILPSENNNHPNSAAMTLKRQQEREKLFQSMYFLYFLDDLMTKYFLLVEDIHREEQEEASKTVPSPRKAWNKQQGGAMMSVTTRSAEKEEKVVFANKQLHYCLKLFITLLHHASEEQKSYYFLLKFHEKYFYYLLHYYQKNWFLMTWYHKICQILIYLNITFISSPAPSLPQSSSEMTGMVVRGYDMIQSHCLSGVFPSILMKLFLTLFQQYQYDFQQRRKGQQQQMQQQQTKYQPPPQIALPEELVDAHSLSDVDKSSSTHHTPKQVHRVRSDYSALTSMPANDQIDFSTSLKVLASPSVKFTSGGDDVSAGVGVSSPMSAMSGMSPKEKSNLIKKVNLQVNTRSINNEEIHSALTSPVQGTAVVNSTSVSTFPHLLTPTVAPTMNNNNTTQNNKLNYFLDYCKLLFSCYYQNEANLMKLHANGMIDMMTHVLDNLMQLLHQTLEETENEGRSVPASVYDINQLQEVCEYVYFLMVYCLNSIPTSTIASSQNHLLNASHQKIVMVIQKYSNHLFKSPPRRRSFIGEVEEKAALERRISHQQTMQHVIEQMLNLYFSERKRNRGVIPSLPPTMTANGEVAGNFVYYRCGFKEMEAILSME